MLDHPKPIELDGLAQPWRLISLGYYDGTTNGLIRFEEPDLSFRYDLVSWDSGEDWRVFCLSELAPSDFETAAQALSVLGVPRWPCWFPAWEFTSDTERQRVEDTLKAIVGRSGPYRIAILSRDLCTAIKAAVNVTSEPGSAVEQFSRDRKIQPFERWLPVFGLNAAEALGEIE
jgi:hypothetical protein